MVEWSIEAFRAAPSVRSIVVAVPPGLEQKPPWDEQKLGRSGLGAVEGAGLNVVEGGATRAQSVSNALEAVGTELVAIHDAARPLVTSELIEGVIATLVADPDASGAIAATPVTDTIKQVRTEVEAGEAAPAPGCNAYEVYKASNALHLIDATLDRGRLWAAQTPQVFRVAGVARGACRRSRPDPSRLPTRRCWSRRPAGGC